MIVEAVGDVVTITGEAFAEDMTTSITDANPNKGSAVQFITGTQSEWDSFTKAAGVEDLVFLQD